MKGAQGRPQRGKGRGSRRGLDQAARLSATAGAAPRATLAGSLASEYRTFWTLAHSSRENRALSPAILGLKADRRAADSTVDLSHGRPPPEVAASCTLPDRGSGWDAVCSRVIRCGFLGLIASEALLTCAVKWLGAPEWPKGPFHRPDAKLGGGIRNAAYRGRRTEGRASSVRRHFILPK